MTVINLALELASLVFLGLFIVRFKLVGKGFISDLTKVVMNIILPCLIVNSIRSQRFEGDGTHLLLIMGLAILVMGVLALLGTAAYLLSGRTLFSRCMIFSTIFGNYTFVGMAVTEAVYGAAGLFIYTIFTLPVRLVFYAAPSFLMRSTAPAGRKTLKEKLAPFCSAPTIAVFVGLVFYFTGLKLPSFLDATVTTLGSLASPLGMIICGMGLASAGVSALLRRPRTLVMALVRNLLAPALVIFVLHLLPISSDIRQVAAVYASVPVPSLLTAFAIKMDCPTEIREDCSAAVLASTLLSILTLPMWVAVISRLL